METLGAEKDHYSSKSAGMGAWERKGQNPGSGHQGRSQVSAFTKLVAKGNPTWLGDIILTVQVDGLGALL
jgi:hypothetical protein